MSDDNKRSGDATKRTDSGTADPFGAMKINFGADAAPAAAPAADAGARPRTRRPRARVARAPRPA